MKISFHSYANITNFHMKSFALSLAFIVRFTATRKWPIQMTAIEDGAYFSYCAYVLRILRYSAFLWVVPTNTGIFLRGLKLCGENITQQVLLVSKMKIWRNHTFYRDNKASI